MFKLKPNCEPRFQRTRKRLLDLERKFKEEKVIKKYRPKISDFESPTPTWNIFYRLQDAFNNAFTCKENVHVFACEPHKDSSNCNRKYIVTTYQEFWHYYSQMKSSERHFYEVISENTACHLYFDLEFNKYLNPDKDGNKMVSGLIDFVCEKLKSIHNLECDSTNVLWLDSSTDEKFSSHLIFHISNAVFKNNYAVGDFVRQICFQVRISEKSQHLVLFVKDDNENVVLFIDESVYSKNRNFRLFLSSKKNKVAVLQRSKLCKFDLVENLDLSLTCCEFHNNNSCTKNICNSRTKKSKLTPKYIFFASLITNTNFNASVKQIGNSRIHVSNSNYRKTERLINDTNKIDFNEDESTSQITEYYNWEILQRLKKFILDNLPKVCDNHKDIGIRKYTYFSGSQTILFDIKGNRYCHNINREHKSNNVFYIIDLLGRVYFQMCYDEECKSKQFKSTPLKIPDEIFQSTNEISDDELLHYAFLHDLP